MDEALRRLKEQHKDHKPTCPCHICGNETEEETKNWGLYIEPLMKKVKIGKPICENCYDNLRYEICKVEKEYN